jgi:hypothetical protein
VQREQDPALAAVPFAASTGRIMSAVLFAASTGRIMSAVLFDASTGRIMSALSMFLPPPRVRHELVGVGVGQVLQVVVGHGHSQPVLPRVRGQAARHGPGPQHPVLLQPQVEVRAGLAVVVQHERRPVAHPDRPALVWSVIGGPGATLPCGLRPTTGPAGAGAPITCVVAE